MFHVYDRLHLDRMPRRYTVEAGKSLPDEWDLAPPIAAPTTCWVPRAERFCARVQGRARARPAAARPEIAATYDPAKRVLSLTLRNTGRVARRSPSGTTQYRADAPETLALAPGSRAVRRWSLADTNGLVRPDRVAATAIGAASGRGRLETGRPGVSDPALAVLAARCAPKSSLQGRDSVGAE